MYARKLALAAGIIGAFAATTAYAKTMSAQDFVTKVSIANQFEIDSSKLALSKSNNDQVKAFAQQMVDDHNKAAEDLDNALDQSKSGATTADGLDAKHQKLMDKLDAAEGDSFDIQYVNIQTNAHKEAVNLFSSYSNSGKDKPLRNFATSTLPTLRMHLKHVRQLSGK